jgi:hypothetical protein
LGYCDTNGYANFIARAYSHGNANRNRNDSTLKKEGLDGRKETHTSGSVRETY